jgi:hypothetical protein
MTSWEYASTLSDGPAKKELLDSLGLDGWELVSVLQGAQTMQLLYVFKRPLRKRAAPAATGPKPLDASAAALLARPGPEGEPATTEPPSSAEEGRSSPLLF